MHPLRMTPKYEQTRPAGCMTRLVVLPISYLRLPKMVIAARIRPRAMPVMNVNYPKFRRLAEHCFASLNVLICGGVWVEVT